MVSLNEIRRFFKGSIELSEPLAKYTTLQVGGTADYFLEPSSKEDLDALLKYLRKNEFPFVLLQPNMLVSEKGFRGAAILFDTSNEQGRNDRRCATMFKSIPGVSIAQLVERAGLNGITHGGAAVLADSIVNAHDARASDILTLITDVQRTIGKKFSVQLEVNLQLVGFDEEALAKVA